MNRSNLTRITRTASMWGRLGPPRACRRQQRDETAFRATVVTGKEWCMARYAIAGTSLINGRGTFHSPLH